MWRAPWSPIPSCSFWISRLQESIPTQQTEFYDLLCHLNHDLGIAIVLVSHDVTAISKYVSKIACLNQRLYYHGSKEITNEDIEKAYGCPVEMIAHVGHASSGLEGT